MTALRRALGEYLAVRRKCGFKLRRDGKLLPGFVRYLEQSGSPFITSSLAIAWATQPPTAQPSWWISRLVAVRGFAKYLQASDPRHDVPPLELLPRREPRPVPYVYEPADIAALMGAAMTLRSPLMAATYNTLLGLLAVTGLRVGEALALDECDVDLRQGVLLIRRAKFGKSREVLLHPTAIRALVRYARDRDRIAPRRRTAAFFVSTATTRLIYQNVHETFLRLVYAAGLANRRPRRPTIHDLRHGFAIRTVLAWHRAGEDVEAKLPTLSTYLGHVGPSATYWYLTAVPELLGAATARLERAWKARS
ncbi:MAG: tyrosine-type recombinase/integrase [Rhodoglobus sp.]